MAGRASNGESTIYKGADGRWHGYVTVGRTYESTVRSDLEADHRGDGAVVHAAIVRHAPVDVVVHAHAITGALAIVVVAQAAAASDLAAAVVVRDDVVFAFHANFAGGLGSGHASG